MDISNLLVPLAHCTTCSSLYIYIYISYRRYCFTAFPLVLFSFLTFSRDFHFILFFRLRPSTNISQTIWPATRVQEYSYTVPASKDLFSRGILHALAVVGPFRRNPTSSFLSCVKPNKRKWTGRQSGRGRGGYEFSLSTQICHTAGITLLAQTPIGMVARKYLLVLHPCSRERPERKHMSPRKLQSCLHINYYKVNKLPASVIVNDKLNRRCSFYKTNICQSLKKKCAFGNLVFYTVSENLSSRGVYYY